VILVNLNCLNKFIHTFEIAGKKKSTPSITKMNKTIAENNQREVRWIRKNNNKHINKIFKEELDG